MKAQFLGVGQLTDCLYCRRVVISQDIQMEPPTYCSFENQNFVLAKIIDQFLQLKAIVAVNNTLTASCSEYSEVK